MAAPRFQPSSGPPPVPSYQSPDVVPETWVAERPGDYDGPFPSGPMIGTPGPDQGYALRLAALVRDEVRPGDGLTVDDALVGATAVAMRRAGMFGRAPVMADVRMALGIWGFLDDAPPPELVAHRTALFVGVGHPAHHYSQIRRIVDSVPAETLRSNAAATKDDYPEHWRRLLGV